MTGDAGTSVFFNAHQRGFGAVSAADERMHWGARDEIPDAALVETQFLGFNVPEHAINVFAYFWAHPNLTTISGGVLGFEGFRPDPLAAELFDIRNFLADAPVSDQGDLDGYKLENGYRVDVLRPLEQLRLRYDDPSRDTRFDVTTTAVMPPAVTANGKHFDQAMRTEGELVLRGRPFKVDAFHMRDRTWGETRLEVPRAAPPMYWTSPVFGEDFALNVTGVDDPERDPSWRGLFDLDREAAAQYNRGWVWRDGDLFGLASSSIRTQWDRATGHPVRQEIDVVDDGGRELHLIGTVTAACHWHVFPNIRVGFCLARWECDGRTGWGEIQPVAWTDFVHHLMTSTKELQQ